MSYLITLLALGAGSAYGMWQRARAQRFEELWQEDRKAFNQYVSTAVDTTARRDLIITDLKARLMKAEEESIHAATSDDLRKRLAELFACSTTTP